MSTIGFECTPVPVNLIDSLDSLGSYPTARIMRCQIDEEMNDIDKCGLISIDISIA